MLVNLSWVIYKASEKVWIGCKRDEIKKGKATEDEKYLLWAQFYTSESELHSLIANLTSTVSTCVKNR